MVEVTGVAGLQGLGEVDAGAYDGLAGTLPVIRCKVCANDTLLLEHRLGDDTRLVQAIAGERPAGLGSDLALIGAAGLRDGIVVRWCSQPDGVLTLQHGRVEVLHEAGELSISEHGCRTHGAEEALRGDV